MKLPLSLTLLVAVALLTGVVSDPAPAVADDAKEAIKSFKGALKAEKWQERRDAYLTLADHDGEAVAKAVLDALGKEPNPAVQLVGLGVLSGMESAGAKTHLLDEARKARGSRKMLVLLALARQKGDTAQPLLLEILQGKDGPAIAQAALALGQRQVEAAVPHLLARLSHKDWQVRRAAAMAIAAIAQPPPPKPKKGIPPPAKDFRWPVPAVLEAPAVTQRLIAALDAGKGVERAAVLDALVAVHGKDYGLNVAAWKAHAAGTPVDARLERKRVHPPAAFGIPLFGQRIVFIYDNSLRAGDPHRFGTGARLEEVCKVPGGPGLISTRLLTVGQFGRAHLTRAIARMPKGQQFELISFNDSVQPLFGKFTSSSGASRKLVADLFAGIKPDDGINSYGALIQALDMGGSSDAKAWKKGPDEIVFVTCNQPTRGEIKEADVVAAAIGLKARLRMVRIHTIGIDSHPYAMLESMANQTGGVYRNYYE